MVVFVAKKELMGELREHELVPHGYSEKTVILLSCYLDDKTIEDYWVEEVEDNDVG